MVSGTECPEQSTATRVRPNGSNSASVGTGISANGVRDAARDAKVDRLPVKPPFTVTVAVKPGIAIIVIVIAIVVVVVVVVVKRISAVRKNREGKDTSGRTTIGSGARSQNMARRFA